MSHLPNMSSPYLFRRIIGFSGAVAMLLVLAPAGLADRNQRPGTNTPINPGGLRAYTPPSDLRRPSEDHTGGSVRGCGDDIVAIAPRLSSVGQTASTNPTFVWYNSSPDNDPVEFQLYRLRSDNSPEQVLIEQFDTSQEGYESYTLPADKATLTVGENYLWQIVLYCDAAFTNPGHYSSAELDVVALPSEVETTDDALTNAQAYAGEGLWYDALAEVYDANTLATEKFRQDLLFDLADIEAQSDKDEAADLSEQLREIAGPE